MSRSSAILGLCVLAALAACSPATTTTQLPGTPPAASPGSAATFAPTGVAGTGAPEASEPAASGPPSASFQLVGDGGLSGPATIEAATGTQIRCSEPSFDGLQIELFVPSPVAGQVLHVTVRRPGATGAPEIGVSIATTTAPPNVRAFTGTGVSGFDAGHGAVLDSALTEVASGAQPGQLGALTAIRGTVSCGGQTPGTSTIAITGAGLAGPISPVSVVCLDPGPGASIIGLLGDGTATPKLLVVGINAAQVLVSARASRDGLPRIFSGTSTPTLTTSGGSVDADATATDGSGDAVHLTGTFTCGVGKA
jgi:hypothetical protein